MGSVLSNYLGNLMLHAYFAQTPRWLALHVADPTAQALASSELVGGNYVRQRITFGQESGKIVASNNAQVFTGLPVASVGWLGVWDALANGHLLYEIVLEQAVPTTLNGQFVAQAGDVALQL